MRKKDYLLLLICCYPLIAFAELKGDYLYDTIIFIAAIIISPIFLTLSWITLSVFRKFYLTKKRKYLIQFTFCIALVLAGWAFVEIYGEHGDDDVYLFCMILYFGIVGLGLIYKLVKELRRSNPEKDKQKSDPIA